MDSKISKIIPNRVGDIKHSNTDISKVKPAKIKVGYVFTACKQLGPIQQMNNLIRCLDRNQFEPILITLYDEPVDGSSQLDEFLKLDVPHYRCLLSKFDMILGRTNTLKELFEKLEIDVIHSLGVFPDYSIARMKTGRQIITLRNFAWEDYPKKFGKVLGTMLVKFHLYAMKHTTITVTCSKSLSVLYRDKLGLDFGYVCNGVNIKKYEKASCEEKVTLRNRLDLPKYATILVYSGQIIARKNQRFLLEVFKKNYIEDDTTYLLILGDGNDYSALYQEYGSVANIDFRGNVSNVEEYLKASDIYVSSSKSEGMPNGVLEAMATGLPVVLSDIPQHQEILEVNESAGMLYRAGDKVSLREKLAAILCSNVHAMGDEAYKTAHEKFSDNIMSEKYQDLYRKIFNK